MAIVAYDLYGFESDDLESIAESLEKALNIKFDARSSDYWGDYYRYGKKTSESFELKQNLDPEGEWLKKNFRDCGALFYVNRTERSDEIEKLLESVASIKKLESEKLSV